MIERLKRFDRTTLLLAAGLSLFGLIAIFSAGYARSMRDGLGWMPREFLAQVLFLGVATAFGVYVSGLKIETAFRWAKPLWWLTIVGLVGVMTPLGYELGGAHRWYKVGPITIQPAEFAKVACALYLGHVLATRKKWPEKIKRCSSFVAWLDTVAVKKIGRLWPAFWVAVAFVLTAIEPDLGTAAVMGFMAMVMFAVGGVTRKSFIVGGLVAIIGLYGVVKLEPYRLERINTHLHRWDANNVDDAGFQTVQAELGMASGGILGVGPGAGRVKHIIPAPTTDYITATIAEEFGFIGWLAVMSMLAGLTYRLFKLADSAPTKFGRFAIIGIASWIGIQSVVNAMMANGTIPSIGIPLPFVSSGGSSLLALWFALGLTQVLLKPVEVKEKKKEEAPDETRRHGRGNGRTRLSSPRSRTHVAR